MKASAHGTFGGHHAFGDATPLSTHVFTGSDPFTIAGVPIAKDAAIFEAATLGIAYQGQFERMQEPRRG